MYPFVRGGVYLPAALPFCERTPVKEASEVRRSSSAALQASADRFLVNMATHLQSV